MTLGQKIKKARCDANLTQKDLAERLNVTFQTVSKWENDTTEPDLATLRALAKLLECSLEYLISDQEDSPAPTPIEEEIPVPIIAPEPEPKVIATCKDCGKSICEGTTYHNVERKSESGVKEMVPVCNECFAAHEREMARRAEEIEASLAPKPKPAKKGFHRITDRGDKAPLIWGIVIGAIALVVSLVLFIVNYSSVGIGWTIGGPILIGYTVLATIYCIFSVSYIADVFSSVAGWSIRFPGLIFTWDLDGIMWLIGMKILFFILGALVGIATFTLALTLSAVLSIFSFIPLVIYNTHNS